MEKTLKEHLYVLILGGGGGKRLWPRSRAETPKQFIPLLGEKTTFQKTVERAVRLTSAEKIFVVTNRDYVDEVIQQGGVVLPQNIIAEPEAKNTALAMGIGAVWIQKVDPKGIIVNLASDHLIFPLKQFLEDLKVAAWMAASGDYLITVGVKPSFPHTGLGYIKAGRRLKKVNNVSVYKVLGFKEKPSFPQAYKFLKTGKYYWNANLYTWSVASIRSAFNLYAPKIAESLKKVERAVGTKNEREVLREVYCQAEYISIDYAVSEKAKNLLLVPARFSWSYIGDWNVIYDLSKKDKDKNVIHQYGKE